MGKIIGIHGLSNKPEETQLAKWWKDAIEEGLKRNHAFEVDVDFTSVYWADVMYDEPDPDPQPYLPSPGTGPLQRYHDGWKDALSAEALDFGGDLLDDVKSFFKLRRTADLVLEKKLPDLYRYYKEPDIRDALRDRLKQALLASRSQRIMLIAHSMGSIIAYDVLRDLRDEHPDFRVPHFVTIGSPLGLPHVIYRIKEERGRARTPSVVERWTNFADRRDPVAADVFLKGDYEPNDRRVGVADDLVINDYPRNSHKSYGYLRAPEVSEAIRAFL